MTRILTAIVLIPLVLLAVLKAPLWLFALLIVLVAVLAINEYLNIIKGYGVEPVGWALYAMAVVVIGGVFISGDPDLLVTFPWGLWLFKCWTILLLLPLVFGIPVVLRGEMRMALPGAAASAFGVLYLAVPLALMVALRRDILQNVLVVFILFSVWAGDTAAYYVGRSLGRHKLAPAVSPNKTWEGAVASVLASVAVAALVTRFYAEISNLFSGPGSGFELSRHAPASVPWVPVIALGILTNVAAQFGDLFESALKRGAQVKDSGSLLPGHGGMLDRIDALFFAIPVVWYYANLTGFPASAVLHRP
ncbi:MAG TPA: phosphatidate cytidylyltransferase [Candidatus Saccharimonadales bacterium]|jgi:phosphatidate cytidylyltransferase|nr:phosphatidate cytidylyltransferase [Candidatus Saccharimonadales bacterium]